ncbi:MAG TPA: YCF48-related protein [Candidatus Sulfotelmatobacter sp.]|jgi:hypothetical protein
MQNVPKIVRERLRSTTPAVNHPDADALTAFAEQALPDSERDIVLDHLARCGDCRDIVALALPTAEPVQATVRPSPSRSGWLTWPGLRWGFVAAGIVGIASFGVLQYQGRFRAAPMASKQPGAFKVASNEPQKQPLAPFVASAPAEKTPPKTPSPEEAEKLHDPVAPAFIDSVNKNSNLDDSGRVSRAQMPLPHGPAPANNQVSGNQWQQNSIQNQATPPPPLPYTKQQYDASARSSNQKVAASSQAVQVSGEAPLIATETASLGALQSSGADESSVARAKPPMATEAANGAPTAAAPEATAQPNPASADQNSAMNARNFTQLIAVSPGASPSLMPLWTINSAGALQRSFDQGKTWQIVDVNANLASLAYTNATSLTVVAAEPSRAKVERKNDDSKKDKDADKSLKRQVAIPVFRAVAAVGSEVWAGGSSGLLYHSVDGGNHWARIVPVFAGTSLSGDILGLEFPDPQHGKLSTSTAEVWITSDDGQTWRKQ